MLRLLWGLFDINYLNL